MLPVNATIVGEDRNGASGESLMKRCLSCKYVVPPSRSPFPRGNGVFLETSSLHVLPSLVVRFGPWTARCSRSMGDRLASFIPVCAGLCVHPQHAPPHPPSRSRTRPSPAAWGTRLSVPSLHQDAGRPRLGLASSLSTLVPTRKASESLSSQPFACFQPSFPPLSLSQPGPPPAARSQH